MTAKASLKPRDRVCAHAVGFKHSRVCAPTYSHANALHSETSLFIRKRLAQVDLHVESSVYLHVESLVYQHEESLVYLHVESLVYLHVHKLKRTLSHTKVLCLSGKSGCTFCVVVVRGFSHFSTFLSGRIVAGVCVFVYTGKGVTIDVVSGEGVTAGRHVKGDVTKECIYRYIYILEEIPAGTV